MMLRDIKALFVFILCGVGGTTIEAIAVQTGGWKYTIETFYGVPVWLLPGWGIMGILSVSIHKILAEINWGRSV